MKTLRQIIDEANMASKGKKLPDVVLTPYGDTGIHFMVHAVNHPGIAEDQLKPGDKISDSQVTDLKDMDYKVHIKRKRKR